MIVGRKNKIRRYQFFTLYLIRKFEVIKTDYSEETLMLLKFIVARDYISLYQIKIAKVNDDNI
jgi:hypothetical protein